MAQDGDTITYTFSGSRVIEDIADIDSIKIEYVDGPGGRSGSGGRVENVVAEVSNFSELYLWVGGGFGETFGRYTPDNGAGGSSEVSLLDTGPDDSDTEPFIAATGGGGSRTFGGPLRGARADGSVNLGVAPPQGGNSNNAFEGNGAVDGHAGTQATITDNGTTIKGGGSAADVDGEVKISYTSTLSPPDPPSNLSAEVQ